MENLSVSSPNSLNAGEWYHLVGTHVAATGIGKLFINGSLVSTNTFSNTSPFGGDRSNPISIGSNADGVFGLFNGQIDAVGIWNRGLSDSEVTALYNSGAGLEEFGGAPQTQSFVTLLDTVKFYGKVKFVP